MAWLAGVIAAVPAPTEATTAPPLPERVRTIIESRCQECRETYGNDGAVDLDQLAADPLWVVPGRPDASRVYQRLLAAQSSAAPADTTPPSADVEAIRDWIERLPLREDSCQGRTLVTPKEVATRIGHWMESVGPVEASDTHVLSLLHLWNACATPQDLKDARDAVATLLAGIARRTEPAEIQTIGEENALIAVRLSKIAVLPAEWSRLTENAPFTFGAGGIPADWLAARVLSRPTDASGKPEPAFDVAFDGASLRAVKALARSWERNVDLVRAAGERNTSPRVLSTLLANVGGEFLLPARRLAYGSVTRDAWMSLSRALDSDAKPGSAVNEPLPATDEIDLMLWPDHPSYRPRDLVTLQAVVGKACHLTIINVDQDGKAIVLFPNELEQDNLVAPGVTIRVPGPDAGYQFRFDRSGAEQFVAVCQRKQARPDGITYDYERQRFDSLGDWRTFLGKAPELAKESNARGSRESGRRRRGRAPEKEPPPIGAEDPVAMDGRAAITITIDRGG
jgi:hypothetical protein